MCNGPEDGVRELAVEARKWWTEGMIAEEDPGEGDSERFPIHLENAI